MSKKEFNIDINSFNNLNDMDSIYAGNIPVENTPAKVETKKEIKSKTKPKKNDTIDHKKTNGKNKTDNYSITFKIDADIEDYLKNILWINRKNKNEYVNDLIRADMIKRLNLKEDANYNELQTAWDKYKKANNI